MKNYTLIHTFGGETDLECRSLAYAKKYCEKYHRDTIMAIHDAAGQVCTFDGTEWHEPEDQAGDLELLAEQSRQTEARSIARQRNRARNER